MWFIFKVYGQQELSVLITISETHKEKSSTADTALGPEHNVKARTVYP